VGRVTDEASLLVDRSGPVLTLTLNRPHRRNAVDAELWSLLRDVLRGVEDDHSVRALVLTGAGGAFCAGADLTALDEVSHPLRQMRGINEVALRLHELAVPTVAKVTGVAVGAGWNLALCCDLVVATPESRFAQIFARRGLSVDFGGSWLLPRLVGMQQAKRLALLAETIDAERAHALGLVTEVAPAAEIDAVVADLADRLAAGPPIGLAQTKALLHEGAEGSFADALAAEARAQTVNLATDAPAAARAFRDKVDARFPGTWRPKPED
jgi:enoyl-CoA hydratase/carnithine racemase